VRSNTSSPEEMGPAGCCRKPSDGG